MQTAMLFDARQRQGHSGSIYSTTPAAHILVQANHTSFNALVADPFITAINPEVTQDCNEGIPTLNTFCYLPGQESVAENALHNSDNIFRVQDFSGIQHTVIPTECNDVEMRDVMDQLDPDPCTPCPSIGSNTMQISNDIQGADTVDNLEEDKDPYADLLLYSTRKKLQPRPPIKPCLQGNSSNSRTPSSPAGACGVHNPAAKHAVSPGVLCKSRGVSQASSNDDITRLASCLAAMFGSDGSSLIHDFAHLRLEAARGKQKSPGKKARRSPKGPNKRTKTSSQRPANGVSKKGQDGKKLAAGNKKEFICSYDGCGKAFERRYNLKVHTRRHTGEMPYTCPKTEEGCFLYFRWRSSLRHHLKTVHKDVVPISQNTRRGASTPVPVVPIASILQGKSALPSSEAAHASPSKGSRSQGLRVSRGGIMKKLTKLRKNFPAVAVRDPTTEELARMQIAAELKARGKMRVAASEALKAAVVTNARSEAVHPTMDVNPQPPVGNAAPPPLADMLDLNPLPISDGEKSSDASGPRGRDGEVDDIFQGMDIDDSVELALPMLVDLPNPEEFFRRE